MLRYRIFPVVAAAWLIAATAAAGCGGEAPPSSTPDRADRDVGAINLPLVTETGGHRYRLRDAFISVSGPQFVQLASSDDPAETTLSATLQTGSYIAILFGWTLERDDGAGNFLPVPATLVSSQVVSFSIFNDATTTIGYRFRTDGVIVTVGSGELRVNIAVDEVAPVCTPFAAADGCAVGSWCPPAGLTGLPLACIAAGPVALALPCLGATDCVAGAACIDGGAGPVCTALCPSSDAGLACATGGTCQPAAADYGVCAP
jgi:hypothetical protein